MLHRIFPQCWHCKRQSIERSPNSGDSSNKLHWDDEVKDNDVLRAWATLLSLLDWKYGSDPKDDLHTLNCDVMALSALECDVDRLEERLSILELIDVSRLAMGYYLWRQKDAFHCQRKLSYSVCSLYPDTSANFRKQVHVCRTFNVCIKEQLLHFTAHNATPWSIELCMVNHGVPWNKWGVLRTQCDGPGNLFLTPLCFSWWWCLKQFEYYCSQSVKSDCLSASQIDVAHFSPSTHSLLQAPATPAPCGGWYCVQSGADCSPLCTWRHQRWSHLMA